MPHRPTTDGQRGRLLTVRLPSATAGAVSLSSEELAGRLADIELDVPWTQQRAARWWKKHRPEQTVEPVEPSLG